MASKQEIGGADRDRTGDLLSAIQALSQTELQPHARRRRIARSKKYGDRDEAEVRWRALVFNSLGRRSRSERLRPKVLTGIEPATS